MFFILEIPSFKSVYRHHTTQRAWKPKPFDEVWFFFFKSVGLIAQVLYIFPFERPAD